MFAHVLPAFLGAFRPHFEYHKPDYLKLMAQPPRAGAPMALTLSKLLGQPIVLLAQINFAEAPALPFYPFTGTVAGSLTNY